ncbi:MAG: hypothetical protein KA004_05150 [Verrucomicrobiales bacterium]|nr:hypothetical protein [Verrucomicrobiales bacterium]
MLISITAGTVSKIADASGINRRLVQNLTAVDVYVTTDPLATNAVVLSDGVLLPASSNAALVIDGISAGQALYAAAASNASLRVIDWGRVLP